MVVAVQKLAVPGVIPIILISWPFFLHLQYPVVHIMLSKLLPALLMLFHLKMASVLATVRVETPFTGELFEPHCLIRPGEHFVPPTLEKAPWVIVDLDLPAQQRFATAYRPFAARIREVVDMVKSFAREFVGSTGVNMFEELMGQVDAYLLPSPYREEMEGISKDTGVSVPDLVALNLFYELAHLCTSIVTESEQGQIVHGRNLDFGVLLGWDKQIHGWALTEQLRGLTLNLNFTRGGRPLFFGTTFAGHLGLLTGMRPRAFSVSINSRLRHGWGSLLRWLAQLLRPHPSPTPSMTVLWAQRQLLERCDNFQSASEFLASVPLLSGCFFVLGGTRSGEGLVLVRNETTLQAEQRLAPDQGNWFLLQRNYEAGRKPLFLDDRAGTAECLNALGRQRVGPGGLLTVLSSKNTLNKSTVHTTMMLVEASLYETFIQNCTDPCWFI